MTDPTATPPPLDLAALREIADSPTSSPWAEITHDDFRALIARVEYFERVREALAVQLNKCADKNRALVIDSVDWKLRAEAAEAKIAAVREMCTELRDLPVSPDAPDYARQVLTGARSTAIDVIAALDGTT